MRNALSVPFLALLVFCAFAVFMPAPAFAADTAGTVMVATPGAFVKRGGEQMPLKVKDTVQVGDTLVTDATGRVRVWMRDDTTISLGANSHFTLEAYSAAGSKPQLKGAMTGLARLLTGKIAKANPEGTVVNTPLASVGIRGTICTIEASREMTRVAVESCPTDVLVNGIPLVSGQLGIVRQAGGAPQITPLPQDLRRELGGQVAARRAPVPNLAPAAGPVGSVGVGGLAPVTASPVYTAKDVSPDINQALAEKAEELFKPVGPTPTPGPTPIPPGPTPVLPLTATVVAGLVPVAGGFLYNASQGNWGDYTLNSSSSHLSFGVSLTNGNGNITNASLIGEESNGFFAFSLVGGSGQVQNGQFTLGGFQGGQVSSLNPGSASLGSYTLQVTSNQVGGSLTHDNVSVTSVNGDFSVRAEDGHMWYEVKGEFQK